MFNFIGCVKLAAITLPAILAAFIKEFAVEIRACYVQLRI
jgi:hypothetical protein